MKLTLGGTKPETSDAISFTFQPAEPLAWRAGQFLRYTLPHARADDRGEERYFTISAAPHEGHVMLTTRFSEPGSTFKRTLRQLTVGDTIEADGPEGDFIVEDAARPLVLVAGGMGITPYRSILLDLDHRGVSIHATLLYGNRSREFVFQDELETLRATHPGFSIHYVVSPAHIDERMILALAQATPETLVYISGPEPMVEHFEKSLPPLGLSEERTRRDYFPGYPWP